MWSVFLSTNRADKCFNVTYMRPVNGMDMQRAEIAFCKSKALFAPARAPFSSYNPGFHAGSA